MWRRSCRRLGCVTCHEGSACSVDGRESERESEGANRHVTSTSPAGRSRGAHTRTRARERGESPLALSAASGLRIRDIRGQRNECSSASRGASTGPRACPPDPRATAARRGAASGERASTYSYSPARIAVVPAGTVALFVIRSQLYDIVSALSSICDALDVFSFARRAPCFPERVYSQIGGLLAPVDRGTGGSRHQRRLTSRSICCQGCGRCAVKTADR